MERKKIGKLFGLFLAFMLAMTMLSRGFASLTVARVRVASPGNMTISHRVSAPGKVMENQELAVSAEPGQRVAGILVHEGDSVEAGDVLFQVDRGVLDSQIVSCRREIRSLRLSVQDARTARREARQRRRRAMARAQEDYDAAAASGERSAARALQDLQRAQSRLEEYDQSRNVVEETEEEKGAGERESLEAAVESAEKAYEETLEAGDAALREARHALEDAAVREAGSSEGKQSRLQLEEKRSTLSRLRKLEKAGGKVYSPVKGVVTEVTVSVGEVTGEGAAVLLADLTTGCRFVAQVDKEQGKYLEKHTPVTLTSHVLKKTIEDLEVGSVEISEEDPQLLDVVVYLPGDVLDIGSGAELAAEQKSGTYDICIPVQALSKERQETYVYVVQEEDTILGSQLTAVKKNVQVQDQNETYAALEAGSLSYDDKVIVASSRQIQGGSPVRLEDS